MAMPERHPRRSVRREALMDGLITLFLAEGFLGFSVEDLAARLQCSKSTLYAVAPSKEQLIAAVVRAYFRRSTDRVEAAVEREDDPVARIGVYLQAISAELAPASGAFFADVDDFAPAREIYSRNTDLAAQRVQELVRAAQRPGRPVNAVFIGAVAAQVMAAVQRGEMSAMTALDDAAAYRLLADLIVAGVAGAPKKHDA